jgi:hypothetical protein
MVVCFTFVAVLLMSAKGAEMLGSASASYRPSDDLAQVTFHAWEEQKQLCMT